MADNSTTVDVLSLEDFQRTLSARLGEVDAVLRKLNGVGARPALGTFSDATRFAQQYTSLHADYLDRVRRLRAAIVASQRATSTILNNYRGTEERNRASAADIAAKLEGVATALDGRS